MRVEEDVVERRKKERGGPGREVRRSGQLLEQRAVECNMGFGGLALVHLPILTVALTDLSDPLLWKRK